MDHRLAAYDLDCPAVANLLQLKGKGLMKKCPLCGGGADDERYALSISQKSFSCGSCRISGDMVDLVRLTKNLDREDSVRYLLREMGEADPDASMDEALSFDGRLVNREHAKVFRSFLAGCRDLPPKAHQLIAQWGITPETAEHFGIRYYTHEYEQLLIDLERRFGFEPLRAAGLIQESLADTVDGLDMKLTGAFMDYHVASVPYLVVPYAIHGDPVYVKALPLQAPHRLTQNGLTMYRASEEKAPCPFNVGGLRWAEKIAITKSELDAMGIISLGYPAIALGGLANLHADWFHDLRDKECVLLFTLPAIEDPRMGKLLAAFERFTGKQPKVVTLLPAKHMASVLAKEFGPKDKQPRLFGPPLNLDTSKDRPDVPPSLSAKRV